MMRKNLILVAAVTTVSLVTAACTAGNHGGSSTQTGLPVSTSTAVGQSSSAAGAGGGSSSCTGTKLQATDVGVTPTTITVEIMADIGASSIPGMANGSVNAIEAWANLVNSQGGLACRQVKVRVFDSKIDPTQSAAGYLDGCQNAFAMVGTYALAVSNVSTLDNCKDKYGRPTGLPETPGVALNPLQACNRTDFLYASTGEPCPAGTGVQTFAESSVYAQYMKYALGTSSAHGTYYVALTPPVIEETAVPMYLYIQRQGLRADQMVGLPATATQANFTPIVTKMASGKSQFYFSDAVFPTFLEAKAAAAAQGVSSKVLWLCQTTCYDPAFVKAGGSAAVGTKIAINTLPFGEANVNAEMDTFVTHVKNPDSFAIESWIAARLFQQGVQNLVAEKGPNALTRANILTALGQVKNWTDGGIIGPVTPSQHTPSNCIMVLNTNANGTFSRVWPAKPGTLACGTAGTITVNPLTAFKG
jgi:ABC-type branched-subunit amino acid transport system substrate-binding protein